MLKQHTATAVLRSRITVVSSMPGASSTTPQQQTVKMSTTDGNVRAQEVKQQKQTRPPATYFPLGYKDAAYQWVSFAHLGKKTSQRC